ncbi:MAG: hypothetical protein ACLSUM_03110 [Dysosmobacter welbionis]
MRQPRSAKANPFPYRGSLVCYLSLDAAGSLTQVGHDFSSAAEAYRRRCRRDPALCRLARGIQQRPLRD